MNQSWNNPWWMCIPAVCCVATAYGQTRLDATVASVSGRSVYIDAGRDQGVTAGVRVSIFLASGERVDATVIDVSSNNSRAELAEGATAPEIGARCEITLAAPTDQTAPTAPATRQVPEHPPWQRKEEARTEDTPLLAPAFGTDPKDRPTTFHGRVYTSLRQTHDIQNDSDYTYGRLGAWMELKNPFKDGGRILFQGDLNYDGTDLLDGSKNDTVGRIQRLSYARGLDEHSPYRFEMGRFYSTTLPEIGLIDGVEGAVRFTSGWSVGGGVGFYPTPNDENDSGEDYGFHAFADYQAEGKDKSLSGTIGYLQTWHKGTEDRNLLIGRINTRPTKSLWLYGMAMIDIYGSGDNVKDQAADLTQLVLNANYTLNTRTGFGGSFTRTTWPELLRAEYAGLPEDLVRDGYVNRITGSAWRKVTDNIRLSGRLNYWVDQDDAGSGGEVGADWYDPWGRGSSLYGALYYEDGASSDGLGLRAQARQDFGAVRVLVGYDGYMYTLNRVNGSEDFLRHTLRADVSWSKGNWSFDADANYNLGDNENSITLGLYVQYRF